MAVLNPGPEGYALPSHRAPQESSGDALFALSAALTAVSRIQTAEPSQSDETAHGNLDALIRRVAATEPLPPQPSPNQEWPPTREHPSHQRQD